MENISIIQDKCVGCRSCEQSCPKRCITFQATNEGFLYPTVNEEKCVQCGICINSCPAVKIDEHRHMPKKVWAFKNSDMKAIMRSASGGAADVAAKVILQKNGIVYGAAYDEHFVVKHIEVKEKSEQSRLQSSKYVQSDMNNCYTKAKKALKEGTIVLFTGTPCQIAGLYTFLKGDRTNLYTIDLICHGVPSSKFFEKYIDYQNRTMNEEIQYFNFRSKEKRGWGTQYLIKTKTKTKTKTKILSLDPYGKHFMAGDCYRECCYQCPYADIKRVGDITVGDFWGILQTHPEFYSRKGVSSVFVNTDKGAELFDLMKRQAKVIPVSLEEGLIKQGNLVRPTIRTSDRNSFYKKIDDDNYMESIRVGIQIKERIKAVLPANIIGYIKKYIR